MTQQRAVYIADQHGAWVAALDEKLLGGRVCEVEEKFADGRISIPSGSPGFLVISLDAAGDLKVDHEADIGSIDPHPERVGCHHDVRRSAEKLVLRCFAGAVIHAPVVGGHREA